MPLPKRYAGLTFLGDRETEYDVAKANHAHILAALGSDTLLQQLKAFLEAAPGLDVAAFETDFLPRLADRAWMDALIDRLVSPAVGFTKLVPQIRAVEEPYFNVLEVFWHKKLSIFLSVVDAEKAMELSAPDEFFNVMGFTTYLCFVTGGPAKIRLFDVASGHIESEDILVGAGDMVPVLAQRNSMKFLECESDLVVLAVNLFEGRSFDCNRYNLEQKALVRRSTNDVEAQRILLYSSVLRALEREDGFDQLARFLTHSEPTIRWHVMREMLVTDLHAAEPHLRGMALSDPDASIRATAASVLEKHSSKFASEDRKQA